MGNGPHIFNHDPTIITNDEAEDLIAVILTELENGYGFLPLIGSGFSVPAGAPLIWDIASYLRRCICMALGLYSPGLRPWNPRTDRWPLFGLRVRIPEQEPITLIDNALRSTNPLDSLCCEKAVYQEAIGALAEWRSSLLFLSRLVREEYQDATIRRFRVLLDAPSQDVIDKCLGEVLKDKHPMLEQRMLANLAGLLRLDLLLTTNFDNLLEQAFERISNPLEVSEMHLRSAMPPWTTISTKRSLIKLHGYRYSLRANYTLDALPNEDDRWTFIDYLASSIGRERPKSPKHTLPSRSGIPSKTHIITLGYSAAERRTRALIEHAWFHLDDSFKVIWICHSDNDVKRVRAFTESIESKYEIDLYDRSLAINYPHVGAFFLHLFQVKRRGIPVTGIVFPSASRLAFPPLVRRRPKGSRLTLNAAQIFQLQSDTDIRNCILYYIAHFIQSSTKECTPDDGALGSDPQDYYNKNQQSRLFLLSIINRGLAQYNISSRSIFNSPMPPGLGNHGRDTAKSILEQIIKEEALDELRAAEQRNEYNERRQEILGQLENMRKDGFPNLKLLVVESDQNTVGVTSLCADVYNSRQTAGDTCLWLDMNDIFSTNDLCEQLLDATYYKLGIEQWTPSFVIQTPKHNALELRRLASLNGRHWIIFINTRETPGANRVQSEHNRDISFNWLERHDVEAETSKHSMQAKTDKTDTIHDFLIWLSTMTNTQSPNISIVLLRRFKKHDPLADMMKQYSMINSQVSLQRSCVDFNSIHVIKDSFIWTMENNRECRERRRFLHAIILMQKTRFLSIIWSDVMLATKIGNNNAARPANDDYSLRLRWLGDLEDIGLIRRKYGGFIWMQSLVRNDLRDHLADRSRRDQLVTIDPRFEGIFKEWNPENEETSIHEGLVEWYMRVLDSTGEPQAVFEAIYHSCQAANTSLRRGQRDYERARKNITIAGALLQSNSFLIQTQAYSRGSCRRLEYICDELLFDIEQSLDTKSEDLSEDIANVRLIACEVMRAIAREVGEDGRAYMRHRQCRALLIGHAPDRALQVKMSDFVRRLFSNKSILSTRKQQQLAWIRWFRWGGMLGIASRSYEGAAHSLERSLRVPLAPSNRHFIDCLSESRGISFAGLCELIDGLPKALSNPSGLAGDGSTFSQQLRIEVARVVELFADIELLKMSLNARIYPFACRDNDVIEGLEKMIDTGISILKDVFTLGREPESGHLLLASWCKCRLLLHKGLCMAHLNARDVCFRIFNDAEACLKVHDMRRLGTDRAIIDLYRAEVKLLEADSVEVADEVTFLLYRIGVKNLIGSTGLWTRDRCVILPFFQKMIYQSRFSAVQASLDDGQRFLSRAESILRSRRRSVWWGMWHLQRKLQVIARSVWATVHEEGSAIPYLGLEAAFYREDTIADRLLDEASRMIRVDVYRFATIVEAYMDCICALYVRLILDKSVSRLADRQESMCFRLEKAVDRLREVNKNRSMDLNSNPFKMGDFGAVDKGVDIYVNKVINEAATTIQNCSPIAFAAASATGY